MWSRQLLAAAALAAFGLHAHAADTKYNPRHERLAACSKEAGGRQGGERKKFMRECQRASKAARQASLAICSKHAHASRLLGEGRKKFMLACRKNQALPAPRRA